VVVIGLVLTVSNGSSIRVRLNPLSTESPVASGNRYDTISFDLLLERETFDRESCSSGRILNLFCNLN